MAIPQYQVLFTPLVERNVYGTTVDVTKDIDETDFVRDVRNIKREVDNGDFDIGVFTFGNINLTCINYDGRFNDENDWRSIFAFRRDQAKVDIKLTDRESGVQFRFKGLINEDGTKQDIQRSIVRFRVLSQESILRKVEVTGGQVADGILISTAIKNILQVPDITAVLNFNADNINVDFDTTIDDGDEFTGQSAKDALDELLLASNSILVIDENDNMIVKPRQENTVIFKFFGPGNLEGKENILDMDGFNKGVQRSFSSIKVNETEVTDEAALDVIGFRQKEVSFDWLLDSNTTAATAIAEAILDEFKFPKREIEVTVPTEIVKDISLLDMVSLDVPGKVRPQSGKNIPLLGEDILNDSGKPLPINIGDFKINPQIKWKVIKINENSDKLVTTLKLRVVGSNAGDGTFFFDLFTRDGNMITTRDDIPLQVRDG